MNARLDLILTELRLPSIKRLALDLCEQSDREGWPGSRLLEALFEHEMNEREVVSVVFQGQKAGGKIQRLFKVDGIDPTSIDTCEIYSQENGFPVNRSIIVEADETMGRTRSAKNFALVLEDKEAPLNVPGEAHKLMKIIDGIYASAKSGRPVELA